MLSRNKAAVITNTSISPLDNLINLLPCDKPIKSIQIVENVNECRSNFHPIHKTYDQDLDADLLKENILFGKRNTRYLCISKTEGFENFVLEKLKIINASENMASEGYISIKTTNDSNKKAWNKKQLVYKLSKTENCTDYITDIIILSKYSKANAPEGFNYLGELERVHLCFKVSSVSKQQSESEIIDFTQQIENLKIQSMLYPNVSLNCFNLEYFLIIFLINSGKHQWTLLRVIEIVLSAASVANASNATQSSTAPATIGHKHEHFVALPQRVHRNSIRFKSQIGAEKLLIGNFHASAEQANRFIRIRVQFRARDSLLNQKRKKTFNLD